MCGFFFLFLPILPHTYVKSEEEGKRGIIYYSHLLLLFANQIKSKPSSLQEFLSASICKQSTNYLIYLPTDWLTDRLLEYLLPTGPFFPLHEHLQCFFQSEHLLIYVLIPFCLNYKGSVRPSSLYISLSHRIWNLLNWNSG